MRNLLKIASPTVIEHFNVNSGSSIEWTVSVTKIYVTDIYYFCGQYNKIEQLTDLEKDNQSKLIYLIEFTLLINI